MTDEDKDGVELPSKSQLKREAHALQELGAKLTQLSTKQLKQIPVTDAVRDSIAAFHRLPNSHGARKRQLQFIGKVMRDCQYEEVAKALHNLQLGNPAPKRTPPAELWLGRIQQNGYPAIDALVAQHSDADRQKLRQLLRNIEKLPAENRAAATGKLKAYLESVHFNP